MIRLCLILFFFVFTSFSRAEEWTGKCVSITDGDTAQVLHNGKAEKIRLDGIDAPEHNQAYGTQAKQALSSLIFGKNVLVKDHGKDRYGRTLGTILDPEKNWNINAMLVRNGLAWHYKQYSKDLKLSECETLARQSKLGLWKDVNPVPPWDFRKPAFKNNTISREDDLLQKRIKLQRLNATNQVNEQNEQNEQIKKDLIRQKRIQQYRIERYNKIPSNNNSFSDTEYYSNSDSDSDSDSSLGEKTVHVNAYTKKDGTNVREHWRRPPSK